MPTADDMIPPLTRPDLETVLDQRFANYPTREELRETLRAELANYPTREELRETLRAELANYPTREELRETLRAALANHPTHEELRAALANHPTHDDLRAALANHPTHAQLDARLTALRAEIAEDTRASMRALLEEFTKQFRVVDDQYKDLPDRVQKLEKAVFPPSSSRPSPRSSPRRRRSS